MNGLRRFFREETGTSEVTSTVLMISAVGILLVVGLIAWWTGYNSALNTAGNRIDSVVNSAMSKFGS
ncbi:MAG: hypothetical protein ACLPYB_14355 [Desulfobaccales bacterium]